MRESRQLRGIIAALMLPFLPAFADDVITNVMSSVVSYQYYDALGEDTNATIISPIVSYQFYDVLGEAINSAIVSPIVSYQYFDWPNAVSVQFIKSPSVNYYWQFVTSSGGNILHGRVTDMNGTPIPNAFIEVYFGAAVTTLINADANGYYQIPSLGSSGVYSLVAGASGYQGQMRELTLNANTAQEDFKLQPTPATPAMQQVNRQPTLDYTTGPQGATLKIYDGTQFVPVTAANTPSPNLMTIVLTHGWIIPGLAGGVTDWPTTLAAQLRAKGITAGLANILAWDWRTAATQIAPPQMDTPEQGVALGNNLLAALGANYSQPVHFIGHSLGTMVNAAAINFLHGERVPATHADVSPTPWTYGIEPYIHVTLFDEAADATDGTTAAQLSFDGNSVSQNTSPALLSADNNTTLNYSPPLPIHYTWAENYVSLVGFYHANAVNVLLQNGLLHDVNPIDEHSYPQWWYGQSVLNPTDANNPLGFQNSFEYVQKNSLPLSMIPPAELSDAYCQTSLSDQLGLSPIPYGLGVGVIDAYGTVGGGASDVFLSVLGNTAALYVTGKDGVVQFTGDVSTAIKDGTQEAAQIGSQGINYVSGVAAQGGQAVVNIIDSSASLGLSLTSRLGLGSLVKNNLPHPLGGPSGNNASSTPAMAWVPVQFPAHAAGMAFDFTVSGDPMDDVLVCGVGTNNLFSLEAKYIPTNTISTSTLIDVSQWGGTTNELFFGFMGGTSTNATLQIQNIRFYSLQLPSLQAQISGGNLIITWPLSAQSFSLQTTTNLADPTSWVTLTNVPAIVNLQHAVTNSASDGARFYRLKQ